MPAQLGSKFPFHCFVRAINDVRNITVQARYEWAHQLCDFFNQLGADGTSFNFPSKFTVCREFADDDNNLLPVVMYLLDAHVIVIIELIYSHVGYNLKMTEMQAALGYSQLKKSNFFVSTRKKNFEYF